MTKQLENSIIELLPQIPYVIDQVGEAMSWTRETLSEGDYLKVLKKTYEVAQFTSRISEINFYKTHLVIASLLSAIPDAKSSERFSKFDTASKAVEKALEKVCVQEKDIQDRGCFQALLIKLVTVAHEDQECFAVMLYGILNDLEEVVEGMKEINLKAPITQKDYITILGYSYVIANVHMSHLNLIYEVSAIINKIDILLNGLKF